MYHAFRIPVHVCCMEPRDKHFLLVSQLAGCRKVKQGFQEKQALKVYAPFCFLDEKQVQHLVAPCGWEFNRGRGRGWELQPLSRVCCVLIFKGGFRHYRAVELPGWFRTRRLRTPTCVCGCEIGRDRAPAIARPVAVEVLWQSRGWSRDSIAFNRLRRPLRSSKSNQRKWGSRTSLKGRGRNRVGEPFLLWKCHWKGPEEGVREPGSGLLPRKLTNPTFSWEFGLLELLLRMSSSMVRSLCVLVSRGTLPHTLSSPGISSFCHACLSLSIYQSLSCSVSFLFLFLYVSISLCSSTYIYLCICQALFFTLCQFFGISIQTKQGLSHP